MRNILPHIPKSHMSKVMSLLRLIVKEEDAQEIKDRYRKTMDSLKLKYSKVYDKMAEALDDSKNLHESCFYADTYGPRGGWQ